MKGPLLPTPPSFPLLVLIMFVVVSVPSWTTVAAAISRRRVVASAIVPRTVIVIARGAELHADTPRTGYKCLLALEPAPHGGDERACGVPLYENR
jgi:hypothetical protein